jgi:hypothetical protein
MSKEFSKYNTSYYVNYASNPTFLTSNYVKGPNSNDVSLNVNVKRNITNNNGNKVTGNAFYNVNFQADTSLTFLQGPFTALQQFTDKKSNNEYSVFKSGIIDQTLKQPLNATNYNESLVARANLDYEIIQSVIVEDTVAKKKITFTNVYVTHKTPQPGVTPTQYTLNFNNAILTGSQPIV